MNVLGDAAYCNACGAERGESCRREAATIEHRIDRLDELRAEVLKIADWIEDQRREPDKVLCNVQALRRAARS